MFPDSYSLYCNLVSKTVTQCVCQGARPVPFGWYVDCIMHILYHMVWYVFCYFRNRAMFVGTVNAIARVVPAPHVGFSLHFGAVGDGMVK